MKSNGILGGASLLVLWACGLQAVAADTFAEVARERHRIATERAAAQARFSEQQRACLQRFVVTSCMDDAKRERREKLVRARREENQLIDDLRKSQANERKEVIRRRGEVQTERAARAASASLTGQRAQTNSQAAGDSNAVPLPDAQKVMAPRSHALLHANPGAQRPQRKEEEARRRATFDAAQRAAQAHRAEVEARNTARALQHKPAAPLPLPSSGEKL